MDLTCDDVIDLLQVPDIVSVDTESGKIRGMLGISMAFDGLLDGFYLPYNHENVENLTRSQNTKLYSTLQAKEALVFHNAVYDLKVLERHGYDFRGHKFYDTMLMSHWIDENQQNFSLDVQSRNNGGKPKNRSPIMQHIIDTMGWDHVPFSLMEEYSRNDAFITHELFRKLLPKFQEQGFDVDDLWGIEQRFIWVIADMINLGIKIDVNFCMRELLKGQAAMMEERAFLGINPASPIGLEKLLIRDLGLPVVELTPKGKPSFNKKAMEQYDAILETRNDSRARSILRYRGWSKTCSANYKSYLDHRDENDILHPGFKLHGTDTGRLSCEKPALQQIPKTSDKEWNGNLKKAFVARDGYALWEVDYSQLQFRLTCAYAVKDTGCEATRELLEIFSDPTRDIFGEMAASMEWLRNHVKTLVYLILFGGGANRAKVAFNLDTVEEGAVLVNQFHGTYPGIKKVAKKAERLAQARGYVKYWTGRRRHFPKGSAYYRAFNSIIQGGEAEIVKRAMIQLAEEVCDENCRMVLQIHDAVVFEIKEGMETDYLPKITQTMEDVRYDFGVRWHVEAKRWGEK